MSNTKAAIYGDRYLRSVEGRYLRPSGWGGRLFLPLQIKRGESAFFVDEPSDEVTVDAAEAESLTLMSVVAPEPAAKRLPKHAVRLYDEDKLEQLLATELPSSTGLHNDKRRRDLLRKVETKGAYRSAGFPKGAMKALERLRSELPHFAEPLEHVELALVTARFARRAVRISPMLLLGPAGVGKSYFAERLSAALGLPVFRQQMDSASTAATLAGMDSSWSSAAHGSVFSALALGESANPIFVLDELDKAGGRTHYDPLGPLHGLLEPVTAQHFTDGFALLPIDASHVIWIATANEANLLAAPLRSRFREFDIPVPDSRVMGNVVQSIFHGVLHGLALWHKVKHLSPDATDYLATLTPRTVRLRLEQAVGRALLTGRNHIELADVWRQAASKSARFGFLSDTNSVPKAMPSVCRAKTNTPQTASSSSRGA